jgi:lipopolysaccharide transport system ATP-binding protein
MKKKEIARKFDEIVAFAGVEKFLDTPVKHYSSGMYVRLAFSVAAHMEPDILLVDEVLAVGDAEFQKKCLGKMDEITKKEGRTILFVSHNLEAIRELCPRSILLQNGRVEMSGETAAVLDHYSSTVRRTGTSNVRDTTNRRGDGRAKIVGFEILDKQGSPVADIRTGDPVYLSFSYECSDPGKIGSLDIGFSIHKEGVMLSQAYTSESGSSVSKIDNIGRVKFKLEHVPFGSGTYEVGARLLCDGLESDWPRDMIGAFVVQGSDAKSMVALKGAWE